MDFYESNFLNVFAHKQVTLAARSKAWTVFARSNTAIVGSNLNWGMNICVRLLCVCAVLCAGSSLATGSSPIQGIIPTVYKDQETENADKVKQRAVEPKTERQTDKHTKDRLWLEGG
jgi:hypothetical protein